MKIHPHLFPPRVLVAAIAVACSLPSARADFPPLVLEPVAVGQFGSPVAVTHAGDGSGRLFIVDQRGTIHILRDGVVLPQPFLDLSAKLVAERAGFDERGLLGLAFHPDFADAEAAGSGRFYVYYSAPSPDAPGTAAEPVDHRSLVSEFRISDDDADLADPASERVLLSFNQPQFNHNGGQLAFGPADGLLYISTGDGGSSNDNNAGHTGGDASQPSGVLGNSQDLTKLLGKLLRIDPLPESGTGYAIPPDNPFVGQGGGVREEIFAYGLRNPWRFSFDAAAEGGPRLFLADVGQGHFEEINLIVPGGNYGWRRFEGQADFDATTPVAGPFDAPVAVYAHPGAAGDTGLPEVGLSVTGGYVYRGSAIPDLVGKYIFADWSTGFGSPDGTLLGLEETSPGSFEMSVLEIEGGNPIGRYIPALGADEAGELYVATKTSLAPSAPDPDSGLPAGQLFRIAGTPDPVEVTLAVTRDNTIFSELPDHSNGAGDLFAGRIQNGGHRRALVRFDLAGIPARAEVLSASLRLTMKQTVSPGRDFTVHRVTRDWGEEGSVGSGQGAEAETGEATWTAAFFGSEDWETPGGDFVAAASASTSVAGNGNYTWSSQELAADVGQWLAAPGSNHGWLIRGDETITSAKRFGSRENANGRPQLAVTYLGQPSPSRRQVWEREHYPIGQFITADEDRDGDGIGALLEYAWNFDPFAANDATAGFRVLLQSEIASITFRRDPRSVDLTYVLEASDNLVDWAPLVVSEAGGAPEGPVFTGEAAASDDPELRSVTAEVALEPANHPRRFLRLRVSR